MVAKSNKTSKQKVAVISGINGFIGQNLAGILIEKGFKVAGIPRQLLDDPEGLHAFLKDANPNYIFHLAAYGNHSTQQDANEIFAANVIRTYVLLHASLSLPYEAFINVSSSSVYGTKNKALVEDMTLDTETAYGCTKVCGEYLARMFAKELNKPIVNVRPFSVYGPGEADHRFIPTLIRNIEQGEEVNLYSDPVHDWIYVEDFVEAMLKTAENAKKYSGESINFGTGEQRTNQHVYDILLLMSKKTPGKVNIKSGGRSYDTNKFWKSNISKARLLGWKPKTTLETGLVRTFEYYKDLYDSRKVNDAVSSLDKAMFESLRMVGQGGFKKLE